jgi:hypothetical protein
VSCDLLRGEREKRGRREKGKRACVSRLDRIRESWGESEERTKRREKREERERERESVCVC